MILFWELKFSPVEKYLHRYRLRTRCSVEDVEQVANFMKNELKLDVSPVFQVSGGKYNWEMYIYEMDEEVKKKLTEKLYFICKNGVVVDTETQTERDNNNKSGIPDELNEVLKNLVKNVTKKVVASPEDTVVVQYEGLPLDKKYTFENFIVGPNNRFTHAAAMAVAENLGKTYNPLFIYGGVGLGKTHLMQAIGNDVILKKPLTKILYVTAEKFVSQVIEAIRRGQIQELRDRYVNTELLLVDDIQFISGSESTQEEFFHIFNSLHQFGRQIVLTSDKPPKMLTTLEDRLRSRFEWGLIADIKSPSLETRVAILKRKGEEENLNLDDNILLYIASRLKSNIRELEGFLKRINAYSSLTHQPVDINLVKQLMSELLPDEELTEEEKRIKDKSVEQETVIVKETTVVPPKPVPTVKTFSSFSSKTKTAMNESKKTTSNIGEAFSIDSIYKKSEDDEKKTAVPQDTSQTENADQKIVPKSEINEEEFYKEYEAAVNIVEAAYFYPEGKLQELSTIKQKFAEVIKKHNLRYKISTVFDRSYILENINYKMFAELCKTNKVDVCILLSPPQDSPISAEEFYENILPVMESEKIIFEFVPWKDINKEYRYLNLALDIALSKFRLE